MLKKLSKMLGIALTVTLLASLMSVAAPAAALTAPVVTLDNGVISEDSGYAIRFTVDVELTAGDTITLTFPTGTILNGVTSANIDATDGWVTGAGYVASVFAGTGWAIPAGTQTIVATLAGADQVGEGAEIRIGFTKASGDITNPPDIADDYTISVVTSKETTAKVSNTFALVEPTPDQLPGIVTLYNPSGVIINNWTGATAIQDAINAVAVANSIIKIGAGFYTEYVNVATAGITITTAPGVATEDVVVTGNWTIGVTNATYPTVIDGITMKPVTDNVITITGTGNNTVIQNCVINTKAALTGGVIDVTADKVTIDNCTFDTTAKNLAGAAVAEQAVDVMANADVTITNSTFNVDAGDSAVKVNGAAKVTMTGNTLTGNSGFGYQDITAAVTTATLTSNVFDGLQTAILYDKGGAGSTLTATMNTIKNSTVPTGTLATSVPAVAAVDIDSKAGDTLTLEKNKIMDNNGYSLVYGVTNGIAANASLVKIVGNEFTGNAWGLKNYDTDAALPVQLNYWGAESGPTVTGTSGTGDAIALTPGNVTYKPWTNASTDVVTTGGNIAAANDIVDAADTVGITYTSDTAHGNISLMKYTANPASIEPPAAAIDGGYYDVYSPDATGKITVMFFNTAIDQDTKVYYYDSLQQKWIYCDVQGVAANNAYVYVKIGETGMVPQAKDLKGTVFTLVTQKTIPSPPASDSLTPAIGATDVSITPLFTWEPVAGAARYEVTVADEPSFAIPILSNNKEINFFGVDADDALEYDTTYYWRVRAVLEDSYAAGVPTTAYQVGIFTTEAEPVEASAETTAPIVNIDPVKPEVKVEIPPTKITVQPAGAAIPTYILWIIVVVGAVLIIALIVLIVRTRRA